MTIVVLLIIGVFLLFEFCPYVRASLGTKQSAPFSHTYYHDSLAELAVTDKGLVLLKNVRYVESYFVRNECEVQMILDHREGQETPAKRAKKRR
jgi:hypothetical protein